MVNLLGTRNGATQPRGLESALSLTDVHVHLYGKQETRVGRKLGHVTALASQLGEAEHAARRAAAMIEL
jgi:5-(carboxyamino)imidazole ribonucleotide synthase